MQDWGVNGAIFDPARLQTDDISCRIGGSTAPYSIPRASKRTIYHAGLGGQRRHIRSRAPPNGRYIMQDWGVNGAIFDPARLQTDDISCRIGGSTAPYSIPRASERTIYHAGLGGQRRHIQSRAPPNGRYIMQDWGVNGAIFNPARLR